MPSDSLKATAEYPYVFPPLWFFWKALRANVFFLADTFKIPKRPRINRYRLAGAGGEHWLTVPVHRPEGWSSRIRDVRIVTDDNRKRSHLRTIENGYALAPYLDYYVDDLRELYGQASGDFLRFARATIEWLGQKLGLEAVQWVALSEVSGTLLGDEALVHACAARQVRTYLMVAGSPTAARRAAAALRLSARVCLAVATLSGCSVAALACSPGSCSRSYSASSTGDDALLAIISFHRFVRTIRFGVFPLFHSLTQ